jgi:dihydrofolate reductase
MRKIIAGINITIDGFCDHTLGIPDEEIHQYYADLLDESDLVLYGRITYELMKYWQPMVNNPSGDKSTDEFATSIDKIPKVVFSNTLKDTGWETATLATESLEDTVRKLKKEPGRNVLIGSRSLIVQLTNLNLLDELQLCIHPVVAGKGLPLFDQINEVTMFELLKTRTFSGGFVILYYRRKQ